MAIGDIKSGMTSTATSFTVQPASGEHWKITRIGSDSINFGALGQPNSIVKLTDGTNEIIIINSAQVDGYNVSADLHINNSVYLKLESPGSTMVIGYCGVQVADAAGKRETKAAIINDVATASRTSVQPGSGEEWCITNYGCATWTNPSGNYYIAKMTVEVYDGTYRSTTRFYNNASRWNAAPMRVFTTNTKYIQLYNDHSGSQDLGYCGFRSK